MNYSLTIAYLTSRKEPKVHWFADSLRNQSEASDRPSVIIVDNDYTNVHNTILPFGIKHVLPKPSVWQGEHRLTKEDWWAKSNAHNTAICLCETNYIAFVDDRSVLAPTWLRAVKRAMNNNYAVTGRYEKRANMKVENGVIADAGELLGDDARPNVYHQTRDWYGGSCALPLEWCLQVNGYPEKMCDGLGSEDSMFGVLLRNNNYPMFYDPEMKIVEDRTPGQIDGALKRADKDVHLGQRAKSWAIVRVLHDKTTSQNDFDIRNLRDRILLNHEEFPPPVPMHYDWFDGQLLSEMT